MTTKSIKSIADEILKYKGKCNVDVNALSKQLMTLDESITKHQNKRLMTINNPKEFKNV